MASREDLVFGQKAVSSGMIDQHQLQKCLRLQQSWMEQGKYRSLSQWLILQKYLTHAEVAQLEREILSQVASNEVSEAEEGLKYPLPLSRNTSRSEDLLRK